MFFKLAFRNIFRHKGFSFINISGLTLGLTACLLIGLFLRDERQFDRFVPEGESIYRIYNLYSNPTGSEERAVTPPMFATTLQQKFPEVETTARVMMQPRYKRLFEAGGKKLYEENGFLVDSTFFDVFALSLVAGSADDALEKPTSIVISQELAERYFGDENPVGREMLVEQEPFQVTGVFEKNPKFHLSFDFLIPLAAADIPAERMQSWGWQQFYTYLKVKPGTDVAALEAKFLAVLKEESDEFTAEMQTTNRAHFQPLSEVHLYSANFKFDMANRGNITYVRVLTLTAIFILLIACFNFINLATAKSLQRAKEVGVRKSVGANRAQLMTQFTGETLLLTFISMALAVALTFALLPYLNRFTEKQIVFDLVTNPLLALLLLLLTGIVGILAGFYPALVLSGFQPIKVLKGGQLGGSKPGGVPWLRHGLVVVQFSLSVLLLISTIVVIQQVNFLHQKDLGLNKDQIMFFPMRGDRMFENHESFKNQLTRLPGVTSVSIGYGFPGDAVAGDEIIAPRDGQQQSQSATQLMVDYDYIKTLELQLVAGRDFSRDMDTDKDHAFIINETAVRELGFETPENALGKPLLWHPWGAEDPDSLKRGQVIGVVKDFHYKSLYDRVETTILQIFPDAYWKVAVKMSGAEMAQTIEQVNQVWDRFSPDYPLEYTFLDESFATMYRSEDKLRTLLWVFTAISIFVACLGLFGLAAYSAERRRKEISIRKVLGAGMENVVLLLSKDFVRLVIIALLIASPLAWYLMQGWLRDFAYRIDVGWWAFVLAGGIALGIVLLTVGMQAVKAALADPIRNLRSE